MEISNFSEARFVNERLFKAIFGNKLSGFRGRSGNRSSKVNIVNIVKLFINSSYVRI